MVQSDYSEFFVVNEDGGLLGAISLSELRRLITEQDTPAHMVVASDLVDAQRPQVVVAGSASALEALERVELELLH